MVHGFSGLRLPEGARRRFRAARLPVDLAAGPLRPRVPVLVAERAADGLLPTRRACPRGPAAGDRGAGARRQRERRRMRDRMRGTRPDRPRLRPRGARAGDEALVARRERAGGSGASPISPRARRRRRLAGAARLVGACDSLVAARRAVGIARRIALWRLGVATPGRRVPRRGPSWRCRWSCRRRPSCGSCRRGSRCSPTTAPPGMTVGRASDGAAARPAAPGSGHESRSGDAARTDPGHGGRAGGGAPAPGTADGIVFVLLEDEFGMINLIVPPPVYERHRLSVRTEPLMLVEGKLERYAGAAARSTCWSTGSIRSPPPSTWSRGQGLLAARRAGAPAGGAAKLACDRRRGLPGGGAARYELRRGPQA